MAFTKENAKEMQAKSCKVRKANTLKRKSAKQAAKMILEALPDAPDGIRGALTKMGVDPDEPVTNCMIMIAKTLVQPAMNGDMGALAYLLELAGQGPDAEIAKAKQQLEREKIKAQKEIAALKISDPTPQNRGEAVEKLFEALKNADNETE